MQIPMTNADLSKWISFGNCRVREVHGYNNQASNLYIQFHEASQASASTVISNGAIPKFKSLLTQQTNGFKYEWVDGLDFNELVVAVSTTETSLTLPAANAALDMTVVVDGPYLVANQTGLTVVGDLTTAITTLVVWAEASGPNFLRRLDVVEQLGQNLVVWGCARDSFPAGAKVQFFRPVPASTTVKLNAGQGIAYFEQTASDHVLHQGLSVAIAQTPGGSGQPNGMACRAIYTSSAP